jgi:hypothetical protein
MYDEYAVYFRDGTSTLVWVHEDEDVAQTIVDLCEQYGWSSDDVTGWSHTGETQEGDDDSE